MSFFGAFVPHPPLLIPQVGKGNLERVGKSQKAMAKVARQVQEFGAETVIIISPHAPLLPDAFTLWNLPELKGDFAPFGAGDVALSFETDLELAGKIVDKEPQLLKLDQKGISLDHGALVPLYYLKEAGVEAKLVVLGMSLLPFADLYAFGTKIRGAIRELGRRAVLIASGDLSHRLTMDAPGGYHPRGQVFDREIVDKLKKLDVEGMAGLDPQLVEDAGQCGFNSLAILLGAFAELEATSEILAYEGPFGVGYLTALIKSSEEEGGLGEVALAKAAVEAYVERGQVLDAKQAQASLKERKAAAFVTLKLAGELRGCIGTIRPTRESLAAEIIANGIAAATEDPRFFPVGPEELEKLTYSVDVLEEPELIADLSLLDPRKYGVIVRAGVRQGLLLPKLEGVETVEQQLEIAKRKAGIAPGEQVQLERFRVVRYH